MDEYLRPFDILENAKGKEISVSLKNGEEYKGKLEAFDIHLNLILSESKLISKKEVEVGSMVIRGDAIMTIKNI